MVDQLVLPGMVGRVCPLCGGAVSYRPQSGTASDGLRFCSSRCSSRWRRGWRDLSELERACPMCTAPIVDDDPRVRYCSPTCRITWNNYGRRSTPIWFASCARCGVLGVMGKMKESSNEACHRCPRRAQDRWRRRFEKSGKRRDKRLGHMTKPLLWADGQRTCGVCRAGLDLDRPPYEADSVEVDHIIPLKYGGSDELDNLQLAHRSCNAQKEAVAHADAR